MFVEKLISIASAAEIGSATQTGALAGVQSSNDLLWELSKMLSAKNGFYAFEGSLHVLPWIAPPSTENILDIQAWNDMDLWRDCYQDLTHGLLFFAEDAFGGQFAIRGDEIVSFDPELGETEVIASSVEGWAGAILSNHAQLTGHPVAHEWQQVHGAIPKGKRLMPKTPFVLGGQYNEKNLFAMNAVEGMRYRGDMRKQLIELPDGAQVRLRPLPSK